ncbi:MAG: zinc-ribbon domain-containing protein [Nitrospirae bacterium]|nr:zinc-ribbon domain-containing protein [Nitrospirota bacterium]
MVVVCPKCKTRLKVDETKLSPQGSRFKCPKCSTVLVIKKPAVQGKKSLDHKKILLAHSSASVVENITKLLVGEGYTVVTSADGIDAMVTALKELPAFGIIEVALPKIYGFEVCKKLKSRPETREMKLILVPSIYDKTKYRREPVSLYGADDYIEEHDLSVRLIESINRIKSGAPAEPQKPEMQTQPAAAAPQAPQPQTIRNADAPVREELTTPTPGSAAPAADLKTDESVEKARRLSRTIINDIYLYNSAKVDEAVRRGDFYAVFGSEVKEGFKLYESRIPQEIRAKADFYREAIDNFLVAKKKSLSQ